MSALGREAVALSNWADAERLAALKRIIPRRLVTTILRQTGKDHAWCRCLSAWFMVWFVVAIGMFCSDSYRQLYRWLIRFSSTRPAPGRSTLCEARKRLGTRPMLLLQRQVVKPLADPLTMPRAFYRGMRLMALDGFVLDLPDSPGNARVFGRPGTDRAPGAFPQARLLALCEAGTHVIWRTLVKPYRCGEITMTPPLLRHLQPDMLLMWDRNFFKYDHVKQVKARNAHLLARIKNNLVVRPIQHLSDGSYLAKIYPSPACRDKDRDGIVVRIIDYTLNDPARPGHQERHRLLTTLLDERLDPATTLIELYHVRWEEELAIDELKTHEMERPVLRSQTPAGVVQEISGLLLAHYVVRTLMHEAASAHPPPDEAPDPLRLSFTATLKILRCRLPDFPRSLAAQRQWYENLLAEIGTERLPLRRNRQNPRVIKRKMSNWLKKRPQHLHIPQPSKTFAQSIVILR